jgi:hypothetical protein
MSTTVSELVRKQILAEGPGIFEKYQWQSQSDYIDACTNYIDGQLNGMSNVELLERVSDAVKFGVRTQWLFGGHK